MNREDIENYYDEMLNLIKDLLEAKLFRKEVV